MNNNDQDLLKMFKKQLKVQLIINVVTTAIGLLFIIINRNNTFAVVFTIIVVVIYWLYTSVKLIYLKKSINKLENERNGTTLTKKEKKAAIEASIDEESEKRS